MDKPTVEQSEEKLKVLDFFIAVLKDEALLNQLIAALDDKDYDVMQGCALLRMVTVSARQPW
jgi:hypothetical protein